MNLRRFSLPLRWISLLIFLAAVLLTLAQLPAYRQARSLYPAETMIAAVPVGGLTMDTARQRLEQVYGLPVEVHYASSVFQIDPQAVGFQLDLDSMLAAAQPTPALTFWNYLWGKHPTAQNAALQASFSAATARDYLQREISARYDQVPVPAMPVPGTDHFSAGQPGSVLNLEEALPRLESALRSPTQREVDFAAKSVSEARPSLDTLQVMLQTLIDQNGYPGLIEISLTDLAQGKELHFASRAGAPLPSGIAFTAASTIKIPVMLSVFRRVSEPIPDSETALLKQMIEASDNPSTDLVVQTVIDADRGPLEVTGDLRALGFKNTYWAGFFYDGAPLLESVQTPANQRQDVNTRPDIYNQTTPVEISQLLADLYQCASSGSGKLIEAFPDQIDQQKCQQMLDLMKGNHIGVLIETGLPEGTPIAHKHGWVQGTDGLLHTLSDAGIVFSPGGDYVLSIYLYQDEQLLFDPVNKMVAQLSRAVYNYFNLPSIK